MFQNEIYKPKASGVVGGEKKIFSCLFLLSSSSGGADEKDERKSTFKCSKNTWNEETFRINLNAMWGDPSTPSRHYTPRASPFKVHLEFCRKYAYFLFILLQFEFGEKFWNEHILSLEKKVNLSYSIISAFSPGRDEKGWQQQRKF